MVHKTQRPYTAIEDTSGRFYYHVRNTLLLLRGSAFAPAERLAFARLYLSSLKRYLPRNRWSPEALRLVGRGVLHGLGGPVR